MGRPFVPARDEYELRVDLQCAIDLSGEVYAASRVAVGRVGLAHAVVAASVERMRMGSWENRYLFGFVGRVVPSRLLWVIVAPSPAVAAVAEPFAFCGGMRGEPCTADGEEVAVFVGRGILGDEDERFAVPLVPDRKSVV